MTFRRNATLALLLAVNSVVIGTVSTVGAVSSSPAVSWQSAGDSYSSGEGVYGNVGDCAQSDAAYGPLAADALRGEGWEISSETFTACTGHLVEDYFNARNDSGGKASLWEWSVQQGGPERVDVITMSFGGNDIGFGDVLAQCLLAVPENWKVVVASGIVGGVIGSLGGCDESEDELNRRVDALVDPDRGCSGSRRTGDVDYGCALQIREQDGSIVDFYSDIVTNHLTDRGRLYVVSYPRLFADVGQWPGWVKTTCQGVGRGDTEKLGRVAVRLNDKLREAVQRANQALGSERVVFVDRLSLYRDGQHELCGMNADWLNGIAFDRGDGLGLRKETSFHPNADGHAATANQLTELVKATYQVPWPEGPGVEADTEETGPRLGWDGIGEATFGTDAEQAVAYLTETLGEPIDDSGWEQTGYDPNSQDDQCLAPEIRTVTWPNLLVVFATFDPDQGRVSDRRTMTTYYYGSYESNVSDPLGLETDRGLRLGDNLARTAELYPEASVELGFDQSGFVFERGQILAYVSPGGLVSRLEAGTDMCPAG